MTKGKLKAILLNFGLSEKEAQLYIFLGKHSPLGIGTISKQLRMHKGQVYRLLKNLQKKGLVEASLEYPTRYLTVPFEKVIDGFVKSRREEIALIEKEKNDLLDEWKNIRKIELDSSIERFNVIEGEKKIFHKISQMIKETKEELVSIASVYELLRGERYGIFEEVSNHPLNSKIRIQLLTQLTNDDLKAIKFLLNKIDFTFAFRAKDPYSSSFVFPRMVIKDHNEILLIISSDNGQSSKNNIETALITNCQSIIESFSGVFQDLWRKSVEIEKRILELEEGKTPSIMELIKDPEIARKRYYDALNNGKKEILIVTSSKRLTEISKNIDLIEKLNSKGVSTKILAPVTTENLEATQKLLSVSEVRHIPVGYRETTIIDNIKLFQFSNSSYKFRENSGLWNSENVLFTNDLNYIKETKKILFDVWNKTHTPSTINLRSIADSSFQSNASTSYERPIIKKTSYMQNAEYLESSTISERNVLERIEKERRRSLEESNRGWDSTIRNFGSTAFAAIYPPDSFNLPNFVVGVFNHDKDSFYGEENYLVFYLPNLTKKPLYVPVTVVLDNSRSVDHKRRVFSDDIVRKNVVVLKKEEIQVLVKGNTLFSSWLKPISLGISDYVIPPACLLFEGYGKVKSGRLSNIIYSGRRQEIWFNSLDAYVTFFHPKSDYVGSGTEGFIDRETVLISKPLKTK